VNVATSDNLDREDKVRQVLGVEKEFRVTVIVPIIGSVDVPIIVKAIDEAEACYKAKVTVKDAGPEESCTDFECVPFDEWLTEIE